MTIATNIRTNSNVLGKLISAPTEETKIFPERYIYLNQVSYDFVESLEKLRGTIPTKVLFIKYSISERDEMYEDVKSNNFFTDLHCTKTHSYKPDAFQEYLEFMHPELVKIILQ